MLNWIRKLFDKNKQGDYRGSSKHLKQRFDVHKITNTRLLLLMVGIVGLVLLLIGRLYNIQILNADYYASLVLRNQVSAQKQETMRGEIVDASGNIVVSNVSRNIITYYPSKTLKDSEKWDLAKKVIDTFKPTIVALTEREMKDLYIYLNDNGKELVSDEEVTSLSDKDLYQLKLDRITDELLATITEEESNIFSIVMKMNSATYTEVASIINDASAENIAYLAEHKAEFPGFSWKTSWDREYTGIKGLESIVGSVGPIPVEKVDYFLAKGYINNDTVGISGLEYLYEDYLAGKKSEYEIANDGTLVEVASGTKGYSLKLSIDMDFQRKVEEIVMNYYNSAKNETGRDVMESINFVATNPQTGAVLAAVSIKEDSDGNLYNDAKSAFLDQSIPGSVVKGATVYMGLEEGVFQPDETILDTPLLIKGTIPRGSWKNLGLVSDQSALQLSSNVYMYYVAMRLGGASYVPNQPLVFDNIDKTFNTMRYYFSQFGLGVNTMIDFPQESTGYKGSAQTSGMLLDFAIGQYDSYTTLQLNQYVSTIANGGYRIKPYLVQSAIDNVTGSIVYDAETEILNVLSGTTNIDRVRSGFRACVTTSNCGTLSAKTYTSAAKTGTSQLQNSDGIKIRNNAFISFAPYDNPTIATSCINAGAYRDEYDLTNLCSKLTPDILDYYMNNIGN